MSEELVYPSGKLGAITRSKNKTSKFCEENTYAEAGDLIKLKTELVQKINAFEEACLTEIAKEVPEEDLDDFNKWVKKHRKDNTVYMSKLNILIAEAENDYDNEYEDGNYNDRNDDEDDRRSVKSNESNKSDLSTSELLKELTKIKFRSELPQNEPDIFSGNITEYQTFMMTFEIMIERKCSDPSDKFFYLLKYTSGEANELVKSCYGTNVDESFGNAKVLLNKHYGNEYKIAQQYLNKLHNWPQIRGEDPEGLKKFATFLISCANLMNKMSSLNQLNSVRDIKDILMKLPWNLRTQFRKITHDVMKKNGSIKFQLLVDFVSEQADILNVPLIGDLSDKPIERENRNKFKRPSATKTLVTSNSENVNFDKFCQCCRKTNHYLNDCFFFGKKPLREKEDFIRKLKLCFGCLKTDDHRSKDCQEKLVCNVCKKLHPSCLHRNESTKSNHNLERRTSNGNVDRDVNLVVMKNERIICPVIPVILRSKVSKKSITTYMAIDNWSTTSFMDEKLLKQLGVNGEEDVTNLTTIECQNMKVTTKKVSDLEVLSLDKKYKSSLSSVNAKTNWPFNKEDVPTYDYIKNFREFDHLPLQYIDSNIGMLIGMNEAHLMKPLEIVETSRRGPYASRHALGWAINGPMKGSKGSSLCLKTKCSDMKELEEKIERCFDQDFKDSSCEVGSSVDNDNWLQFVENNTVVRPDNHFEISLPFKEKPIMPNNFFQVSKRFESLQRKLVNDENLRTEYLDFMNTMKNRGFIEEVPLKDLRCDTGNSWFLTHHAVHHKKKGKIRIVFDASLSYNDVSLNKKLWKGPDLANSLIGVLLRFRDQPIAVSADVEKMYYMINVPETDRNYLKFLWFKNDDINSKPIQFRLTVHLFGATTSSSVSNFALKKTVQFEEDDKVKNTVESSFYVDDMLASFSSIDEAIETVRKVDCVLSDRGFNLTSYATNSEVVAESLVRERLSNHDKFLSSDKSGESFERTLGLRWDVKNDELGFDANFAEQPDTRRGVLSFIASIYDPLFLVTPALIPAKRIFQALCSMKLSWDDPLPEDILRTWNNWKHQIPHLTDFSIPRCYRLECSANVDNVQLHIFVDGSETAYGAVSYIRLTNSDEDSSTSLLMSKSRLTPMNRASLKTVPRIELAAAKIGVELFEKIKLTFARCVNLSSVFFWSDSTSTLQYINSEEGKFNRFVDNRVSYIRSITNIENWKHVPGNINPADILSRGVKDVKKFTDNKLWKEGPAFLRRSEEHWPSLSLEKLPVDDAELKKNKQTVCLKTVMQDDPLEKLMNSTSSLFKLKVRVATFLRLKRNLLKNNTEKGSFSVTELSSAETEIWKYCQKSKLSESIDLLSNNKQLPKSNPLRKLNPFLDDENLLRVGGRISNADLPYDTKHPVILHGSSYPVKLLVKSVHDDNGHLGKDFVLSELKQTYHIVKANKEVSNCIKNCIPCKRIQARPLSQQMAELPADRLDVGHPPFTNTGVDVFGPFYVSIGRGRAQEKRYGVIFTCLTIRATHLELTPGLDTNSFINSLRRFIARRGTPKLVRSDNGTNFTAAEKELKCAISDWNMNRISNTLLQRNIEWIFNPPYASHFGGVYERQIRTIRKILNSMLLEFSNKTKITDDLLSTLFCEIENIMNNKPISILSSNLSPLRPNDLLRMNNSGIEYPPGIFNQDDTYNQKKWRQSQYLADVFWHRFKREYIPIQNVRQKWHKKERSLKVGDVVIVSDLSTPRNSWCLGKVTSVKNSKDSLVRSVHIQIYNHEMKKKRIIQRPIDKLVLLVECEDQSSDMI